MAEAPRPRPVEHYNPRPLILGLCFFWGVAVGLLLFWLSPQRPAGTVTPPPAEQPAAAVPLPPTRDDRFRNAPPITDITAETSQPAARSRPTLGSMELMVPPPALTTEGGLTGRTARPLGAGRGDGAPGFRPPPPQPMTSPPPIPDLMP